MGEIAVRAIPRYSADRYIGTAILGTGMGLHSCAVPSEVGRLLSAQAQDSQDVNDQRSNEYRQHV